jgi:hypothetical protein
MDAVRRWAGYIFAGVVVVLLAGYLADTGVFLLRPSFHAQSLDTVKVVTTAAIPLKSGKTELDAEGSIVVTCSRSIFPQSAYQPCWYLRRHASRVDQF